METEQTTVAVETTEIETLLSETTGLPRHRTSSFLIPCLLILLTLFAYWQVRHHAFIGLDDNLYVTHNLHIQRGLTWENVRWSFTATHTGNWHPLTWYPICWITNSVDSIPLDLTCEFASPLPLVGLFVMAAYGIPEVLKGGWARKLALYVVVPLLIILLL